MKKILFIIAMLFSLGLSAQVSKVNLQASGLTCSMCSNAINKALRTLSFVEKVDANIQNSSFEILIKPGTVADFDKIRLKVEGAGFSVASFTALMHFDLAKTLDDHCLVVGETAYHFVNGKERVLDGDKLVKVLDKGFVTTKEYKKNINLLKDKCYERIDQKVIKVYHLTI